MRANTSTWINLTNMTLSEKSQSQKTARVQIHLYKVQEQIKLNDVLLRILCKFARAATDWIDYIIEIYFLTIMEIINPRSMRDLDWFLMKTLSLACRCCLLPMSTHVLTSVHVCVQISSSHKDTSPVGLRPTLMTSF